MIFMATLLLAEDGDMTREALTLLLKNAGHTVIAARDGAEAQALLDKSAIDLCLFDIWMPKVSGLDVLKHMRTQGDTRPVILMSGGGPGATLEQATALADIYAASEMIFKPFEDEELLGAINKLLHS
jgi:DNA-binding NtrC family response regulator